MISYYLLVEGTVTDVGFRVFVKQIANNLGIGGYVTNFGNKVKIFCDVDSDEVLEKFITQLKRFNVEKPDEDVFGIYIKNIGIFKKGKPGYDEPEYSKLQSFCLDHELVKSEDKLGFEKEMLTRMEAGTGVIQFKFNFLDKKYDKISRSLTSLEGFFKLYSVFMGVILLGILCILAVLVSKVVL